MLRFALRRTTTMRPLIGQTEILIGVAIITALALIKFLIDNGV